MTIFHRPENGFRCMGLALVCGTFWSIACSGQTREGRIPLYPKDVPAKIAFLRAWFLRSQLPCWMVHFLPGGKKLAILGPDGPLIISAGSVGVGRSLGSPPTGWRLKRPQIYGAVSSDGRYLATVILQRPRRAGYGSRQAIAIWDIVKRKPLSLLIPPDTVTSLSVPVFSRDGRILAAGCQIVDRGPQVLIWNVHSGKLLCQLHGSRGSLSGYVPQGLAFLPNHRLVESEGGWLLSWDYQNGHLCFDVQVCHDDVELGPIAVLAKRRQIACGWLGGEPQPTISLCNSNTGLPIRTINVTVPGKQIRFRYMGVWGIQAVENGDALALAVTNPFSSMPGRIVILNIGSCRVVASSRRVVGGCYRLSVAPKGDILASGGFLGVRLWSLQGVVQPK